MNRAQVPAILHVEETYEEEKICLQHQVFPCAVTFSLLVMSGHMNRAQVTAVLHVEEDEPLGVRHGETRGVGVDTHALVSVVGLHVLFYAGF